MNLKLRKLSMSHYLKQRNQKQLTHDIINGAIERINRTISPHKIASPDLYKIILDGYAYSLAEVSIRELPKMNMMVEIMVLPYPEGSVSYDRHHRVGQEAAIDTLVDKLEKILAHHFGDDSAGYV